MNYVVYSKARAKHIQICLNFRRDPKFLFEFFEFIATMAQWNRNRFGFGKFIPSVYSLSAFFSSSLFFNHAVLLVFRFLFFPFSLSTHSNHHLLSLSLSPKINTNIFPTVTRQSPEHVG